MAYKYNWQQLKSEFLQGKWLTISSFLRDKGIQSNSRTRTHTKGWKTDKENIEGEILSETENQYIISEVEIRQRQQKTARLMQYRALQELHRVDLHSSEDVRKMMVSGLEQERSAVGITSKDANLTQVNINLGTKTNLDKMIEKMNYLEVLELISELKKVKENRNVTKQ